MQVVIAPQPRLLMTPTAAATSGLGSSLSGSNVSLSGERIQSTLELEAVEAVHEMSSAVNVITVSDMLPRTPQLIFVNVTTLEGQAYCLELTMKGWRVTSPRHDCMNGDINSIDLHTRYFKSPYKLMERISSTYSQMFHQSLSRKLEALQESTTSMTSNLNSETTMINKISSEQRQMEHKCSLSSLQQSIS